MKTEIRVNGRSVRVYNHAGLQYVEGRLNSEYTIHLNNTTGGRVMAVISVDGVNVINGKPATGTPEDAGYVLNAWQSYEVKGFRHSNESVASFVFGKKGGSYATGKGEAANCGIIAVRYFSEKEKPQPKVIEKHIHHDHYHPNWPYYWEWPYTPYRHPWRIGDPIWYGAVAQGSSDNSGVDTSVTYTYSSSAGIGDLAGETKMSHNVLRSASANLCQASLESQNADFNLGTQWGQAQVDKVTTTEFEAGKLLEETTYYYSDAAGLEKAGIQLKPEKQVVLPQAFRGQYCEPPVGWKA